MVQPLDPSLEDMGRPGHSGHVDWNELLLGVLRCVSGYMGFCSAYFVFSVVSGVGILKADI